MFGWKSWGDGRPRHAGPRSTTAPSGTAPSSVAPTIPGPFGEAPLGATLAANDPTPPAERLVIGRGLTFNGEISTCDHLVVGGSVIADLDQCQILDIAPDGSFHGTATVADADIAGRFEGELRVLGCLRIRAEGRVRGRITYGGLAIEPGGELLGIIESAAQAARVLPRPVVVTPRPATVRSHDGTV